MNFHISGESIVDTQSGTFMRAIHEEMQQLARDIQRMEEEYLMGKYQEEEEYIDPDYEMDEGL